MLESLQQADEQLLLFLNGLHSPFWDSFMWIFTGKLTWGPMYVSILYVLIRNLHLRLGLFTCLAVVLTIVYADQICASLIRPFAERLRPSNPSNPVSELIHLVNGKRGGRYGFPSCHAANSFALAFFTVFLFRSKALSIFILLWATLNSYSRIYLGVHYPGDLFVGMLVGLSGAFFLYVLYRYCLKQRNIANILRFNAEGHLLRPGQPLRYTRFIIYTGTATTGLILLYSALSLP